MNPPRVSVCVISYNHAAFIEAALRSVILQETPFSFEVIVADDCSTDDTRAIAERVASQTSVPFRFLARERQMGARDNYLSLLAAARGEYIAYLEADDEWLSQSRLASQVMLLDARADLSGCFGRARVQDSADRVLGDFFDYHRTGVPPREVDQRRAVDHGSSGPSCTFVFRRSAILDIPEWYRSDGSHQGLSVVLTGHGPLMFVDELWGLYRVHPGGTWSMQSRESHSIANFRYAVALASDDRLVRRYPGEIGQRLALSTAGLVREKLRAKQGLRSLLPLARELCPAATAPALRAVGLALPGLARFARRAWR